MPERKGKGVPKEDESDGAVPSQRLQSTPGSVRQMPRALIFVFASFALNAECSPTLSGTLASYADVALGGACVYFEAAENHVIFIVDMRFE